jgi:hypothetical protein
MLEQTADSLADLLGCVRAILGSWKTNEVDAEVWFRGESRGTRGLLPGIYRPENDSFNEMDLFCRFEALACSRVDRPHQDEWEWYFLAQHNGLPTRLLDWTANLFVAAYFAVERCAKGKTLGEMIWLAESEGGNDVETNASPTIWMLDANDLNRSTVGEAEIYVPGGQFTRYWLPDAVIKDKPREITDRDPGATVITNESPIALLPPRTNHRLIAQQGTFTLHGAGRQPLEHYYGREPGHRLARISIRPSRQAAMWRDLQLAGIHQFAVFPDLPDLAVHLKHVRR